ncbi:hypothetical protein DRO66_09895 [Candidatus Bathyarchaeota archaeon]|nr:MAG: hypothetical protein DRO66_09895 [Candidatus Bathyarchaeota archaeon]
MLDFDEKLDLLSEYMGMYIQVITEIKTRRTGRYITDIPTFDKFIETHDQPAYSMKIPHYRERKVLRDGDVCRSRNIGMGEVENEHAFRDYNYWHGIKYYTGGNVNGDWTFKRRLLGVSQVTS